MFGAFRCCAKQAYGLHGTRLKKSLKVKSFETILNITKPCLILSTRNASGFIPPPPTPPPPEVVVESLPEASQFLNALGEQTLSSLGLASWYPSGLVQSGLEHIHVGLDIPWWGAIVIGTTVIKLVTLPLTLMSQKNSANMNNHMPQISKLQNKVDKAKRANNSLELAQASTKLYNYMTDNNIRPFRNFVFPILQMPIFISVFIGIRQMANLPVESMANGGLWWFIDLTTSDPFFILPVLTMATFSATVELGIDTVKAGTKKSKMFMRALPVVILPFTLNFPSGILLYWLTSNGISLIQAAVMKIPRVRNMLKIPAPVKAPPPDPSEKVPFFQGLKDSWSKSKASVNVEERMRIESVKFREAGIGAIPKTYDYNPKNK